MKFELHILLTLFMLWNSHTASSHFLSSLTGGNLQFQALLSIKDQVSQDPFGILDSWNNSSHFCNWTGVSCNHEQQNVLGLNLSGSEFSGNLSASIGNLTFLKDLNLENNFFVGSIPQEIGQLYHLQRLVLSNNSFKGEIPRNFSYLVEISVIELDRNNLIGTIPAEIGSLSNLIVLDISLNNLSGKIPSSLGNLSDLRVLSLSFNNLEGIIPPELGMLSKLQFLQVTSNNLAGPLPLYNITSIVEIVLTSNKLSGSLPWDFGMNLPNLQTFSVGENQFHGFIPASVCNISGLVILDISGNSLSGPIPMDLGNLKQLQRLDLGGNSLGNNVTIGLDFLTSLINCTKLKVLHLNDNSHSGILPDSIANLSVSLVSLRLDRNYISGKIPFVWKNLKNLERLALSDNSLNGAIPDSIGELNKLQGLYLSNNRFVGEIPSSIGNITLLTILEMHLNMLEGSIPTSLSNCRNLLALDLSQNRLNGVVIRQIFDLFTLTYLNLSNNLLSGSLPFEIGILRNLISFDISRNKLSGKLPYSIYAYTTLQFFSIQGNNFNSSIPSSFSSLRNIQLLDLSSNNISGQIPLNFTSFHYIHFLNLSFNVLEGEVPKKGIFMNATLFSIIGNENICGGMKSLNLPKCPSRRSKVKFSVVLILPAIGVLVLMVITYIFVFKCRPKTINVPPNPLASLEDLYPKLSYDKLHKSTDGFSLNHLIGKGRFSSVYKGILSDGQMVAVKVINLQERGAKKSFLAECEILKNIRHRNLVKIITSCSSTDSEGNEFKALVYEFMRNGDLDSWLHPITSTEHLDHPKKLGLIQRFNIAIDVATTLVYLHHSCDFPVIHHDIKPSNILLDNELHARVGDFGSARSLLLPTDERKARTRTNTVGIIGTVGYIALEYGTGGRVSTLVDVYSYGIVLLEMFTGKRPTDSMFKHNFSLRDYVKMAIPEHVMRIADPQFLAIIAENNGASERRNNQELMNCLTSIFKIGVACSAPRTRERMEITDALMQLRKLADMKCLQDDYLGNYDNGHYREPHTQAGETSNQTDVEVEPKRIQKLFLIGLEGSGTSTIFNQAKILYGNKFSPEELHVTTLFRTPSPYPEKNARHAYN